MELRQNSAVFLSTFLFHLTAKSLSDGALCRPSALSPYLLSGVGNSRNKITALSPVKALLLWVTRMRIFRLLHDALKGY